MRKKIIQIKLLEVDQLKKSQPVVFYNKFGFVLLYLRDVDHINNVLNVYYEKDYWALPTKLSLLSKHFRTSLLSYTESYNIVKSICYNNSVALLYANNEYLNISELAKKKLQTKKPIQMIYNDYGDLYKDF